MLPCLSPRLPHKSVAFSQHQSLAGPVASAEAPATIAAIIAHSTKVGASIPVLPALDNSVTCSNRGSGEAVRHTTAPPLLGGRHPVLRLKHHPTQKPNGILPVRIRPLYADCVRRPSPCSFLRGILSLFLLTRALERSLRLLGASRVHELVTVP